jgi:hypothetical protein
MNLNDFGFIVGTIIASMGGSTLIVISAAKWIGGVWADRQLAQYQSQLDIFKTTLLRYSGEQFTLYNKLWYSLYDLKKSGDILWEEANPKNLKIFSTQLNKTYDEVEKNYLLLEKDHYDELINFFNRLKEYQHNKIELIKLYMQRNYKPMDRDEQEIRILVNNNREIKETYEVIINKIRDDLRKQIRGDNQNG